VGDAEALARQAVQELAGDGLARGEADRVHKAVVPFGPGFLHLREQALDLGVVADIAVEGQRGAELDGVLGAAVLEALADVAERQFGPLTMAGLGDAVGDRTLVEQARDQQALAGEKSHGVSVRGASERRGFSHGPALAGRRLPAGAQPPKK
jgi:hypothetical protein